MSSLVYILDEKSILNRAWQAAYFVAKSESKYAVNLARVNVEKLYLGLIKRLEAEFKKGTQVEICIAADSTFSWRKDKYPDWRVRPFATSINPFRVEFANTYTDKLKDHGFMMLKDTTGGDSGDQAARYMLNNPNAKFVLFTTNPLWLQLSEQNVIFESGKLTSPEPKDFASVSKLFGFHPSLLPLYKTLVGDATLGIPTTSGFSAGGTKKLINKHSSLVDLSVAKELSKQQVEGLTNNSNINLIYQILTIS